MDKTAGISSVLAIEHSNIMAVREQEELFMYTIMVDVIVCNCYGWEYVLVVSCKNRPFFSMGYQSDQCEAGFAGYCDAPRWSAQQPEWLRLMVGCAFVAYELIMLELNHTSIYTIYIYNGCVLLREPAAVAEEERMKHSSGR